MRLSVFVMADVLWMNQTPRGYGQNPVFDAELTAEVEPSKLVIILDWQSMEVLVSANRRSFLNVAMGAAVTTIATASPVSQLARAAGGCGNWFPYGAGMARECSAGVRVGGISAQQRCDQWCWAACVEAAFEIGGHRVPQEAIVEKLYGSSFVCAPAVGAGIVSAINGPWQDRFGDRFFASARVLTDLQFGVVDPNALQRTLRFLANDVPLINGALGHATLVTRIDWAEDNFGNFQLTNIVVRDPWPGNPNRRSLSAGEVSGTNFLAAVSVR